MKVRTTSLPDVLIIEPRVFGDDRGFFFESFNQRRWQEATGLKTTFVQHNHSSSRKNVLRGLHYQIQQPQGKLVRVIAGEVFDVAVDLRKNSPTLGQWTGEYLSADNKKQFWVPEGFAHGFLVLSEKAEFFYLATDYYAPESERAIIWNDPDLNIDWPLQGEPCLSEKTVLQAHSRMQICINLPLIVTLTLFVSPYGRICLRMTQIKGYGKKHGNSLRVTVCYQ